MGISLQLWVEHTPPGHLTFNFHQVRSQVINLCVPHHEHIAEDGIEKAAVSPGATDMTFGYDYIVLFSHASDCERGASYESVVLYLFVKGILPNQVKLARHFPYDIIGKARQYLFMVAFVEALHVPFGSFLVFIHSALINCA
jgi:hypothetical protein